MSDETNAAVAYPHIAIENGVALIAGTRTKVIEVVLDRLAHHWDADEIHRQHPHLSLAQIYSALAYYHDHKAELDQDIECRLRRAGEIEAETRNAPLQAKLRAASRLP